VNIDYHAMPIHKPTIEVFGPVATHDQACAVCGSRHAVLDLNDGHFHPCWACQDLGWRLSFKSWLPRWFVNRFRAKEQEP
jgi:hypothetical protein